MPTMTEPNVVHSCPKCEGPMWDKRETKKNPKAPDYKCKDTTCEGVVWPPWNGARPATAAAANAKGAYSGGPHIPELDGPQQDAEDALPYERFDKMAALYTKCYLHAAALAHAQFEKDVSDTAVSAMAATIYIQACQSGLHR